MAENKDKSRFSPAHIAGMCLLPTALLMGLVRIDFALLPLSLFLGLCAVAPFFPKMEFFLPVVNRGKTGRKAIALTFDDGPDPVSTPFLLDLLSRHEIQRHLFCQRLQGRKISCIDPANSPRGSLTGQSLPWA